MYLTDSIIIVDAHTWKTGNNSDINFKFVTTDLPTLNNIICDHRSANIKFLQKLRFCYTYLASIMSELQVC